MVKIIAGPCSLENLEMGKEAVDFLSLFFEQYPEIDFVFKTSFDKANRTSGNSPRGAGIDEFVKLFYYAKGKNVKVLTDVHTTEQAVYLHWKCKGVIQQIPAMLSRQTDLIKAASRDHVPVNIKKGQFSSPYDMKYAAKKASEAKEVWLTERGTTFGYNNLVVDYRSFKIMKDENPDCKIIFDCTHSTQLPGAGNGVSSGQREFSLPLAKASIATGYVDGLFLETHLNPEEALSDGPNMIYWRNLPEFIDGILNGSR